MSKRSDLKEELARRLDAGEISQAYYDERMARMGVKGSGAKARYQAARAERRPAQREGRADWRPGQAEPEPAKTPAGRKLSREEFAFALMAHQSRLGLTQAEMAERLEVSPRTMQRWMSHEADATHAEQIGIIAVLRVTPPKK